MAKRLTDKTVAEARKSTHLPSERECAHPGMTGVNVRRGWSMQLQSNILPLRNGWDPSSRCGDKPVMNYVLVFIGGGLGASLRHTINLVSGRILGTAFPYHTFIINITGSIVMGLIAGYLAFKGESSQPWRLFLMTGILGGYTTFSAFSLDTALLYERGEIGVGAVLRAGFGGVGDRRPVRRPGTGSPSGCDQRHGHTA